MSPLLVYWEEDGSRTRALRGLCRVCFHRTLTWREQQEALRDAQLVSPTGLVHHADEGRTFCGKDATGDDWWWRL